MIINETNPNPCLSFSTSWSAPTRQKPGAGLLEPLLIWKRDSDSCTCSCFQNPVWGWMLCSSAFLPWLWVVSSPLVPSLAGNSPEPKRDIGFLSYCWEKVSVCQDHQTGRDREEKQESERREGDRGLIFFPSSVLPLQQSPPTRDVSPGCGQRCTILFPCSGMSQEGET